ncbi:MAG: hypothetical protein ACREA0_22780, partial [bacterium]
TCRLDQASLTQQIADRRENESRKAVHWLLDREVDLAKFGGYPYYMYTLLGGTLLRHLYFGWAEAISMKLQAVLQGVDRRSSFRLDQFARSDEI